MNNQDGAWPPYSAGSSAGALSSGSSSSSTISSSYPSYLGCNVTSSPSATYNPPVLTYTDISVGGSGSTAPSNNVVLDTSIAQHGQIAPSTAGMTHLFLLFLFTLSFFCAARTFHSIILLIQNKGLGDCDDGVVSDFGSEYAMLSTNRYNSNIATSGTGSSSERSGNIEMNSSSNDQYTHYSQHIQGGSSKGTGCGGGGINSTVNSSHTFHTHHNIGHFTPSTAFISGTG